MLSPELESRISKIIEKLDQISLQEGKSIKSPFPLDQEKYEYVIQKNAQKRMSSQVIEKISDFFNPEKETPEEVNNSDDDSSIAFNVKKLITIGEFQIEFEKLLQILEESLSGEKNKDKNYLEKYVDSIFLLSDDDSFKMENETKIKKFGESLEKKYYKISLLLKRYIKENNIVDDLIKKENNNLEKKKPPMRGKRRSLIDNVPYFCDNNRKAIKELPNFGNTFLHELEEDIKKGKRTSCVNFGKEKDESDKESEDEKEEEVEEKGEKIPVYRPGKLRSSFMNI